MKEQRLNLNAKIEVKKLPKGYVAVNLKRQNRQKKQQIIYTVNNFFSCSGKFDGHMFNKHKWNTSI